MRVWAGLVIVLLTGSPRARNGPEILESDNQALQQVWLNVIRNSSSAIAVKGSMIVHHLVLLDGDFSCERLGEYGRLSDIKWRAPFETGSQALAADDSVVRQSIYIEIGRGCRACIYNELTGDVLLLPVADSQAERRRNWRFLPCPELMKTLRTKGLSESTVARFAERLFLTPDGEPLPASVGVDAGLVVQQRR